MEKQCDSQCTFRLSSFLLLLQTSQASENTALNNFAELDSGP